MRYHRLSIFYRFLIMRVFTWEENLGFLYWKTVIFASMQTLSLKAPWRVQSLMAWMALSADADGVNGAVSGRWSRCQQMLMARLALSADADGAVSRRWWREWRCQQTLMAWMALLAGTDGVNGAVSGCWWREWCCQRTLMTLSADADCVSLPYQCLYLKGLQSGANFNWRLTAIDV